MPTPITINADVDLDFRKATAQASAFQKQFSGNFRNNGLKSLTTDANQFENALGKATTRIVSLGAAAVVFNTLRKSFAAFADATIEVEQSLARINVSLGQSSSSLKKYGDAIFDIASNTGSTFEEAAKAAELLSHQGLGAAETLKRLNAAMTLSRISGTDAAESVKSLTAAINSFSKEGLSGIDVADRFAAVSSKYGVSSKDLGDAVSGIGESASEAGVSLNQLLGIVTAVQQTTQQSGQAIKAALTTILSHAGRPEILEQLQQLGVAVKDTENNVLPTVRILQNLAGAYDGLNAPQKNLISLQLAGTSQSNVLKAALKDLVKENGIYNNVLRTTASAQGAAAKQNEVYNKTLGSEINSVKNSIQQLLASLGGASIGPFTKQLIDTFQKAKSFLSGGDSGEGIGKSLGEGMLRGIANVISGPGIAAILLILSKGLGKVIATIGSEAKGLLSINDVAGKRAQIQQTINSLIAAGTSAERETLAAANGVLQRKEAILAISERIRQTELIGSPLQNAFLGQGFLGGTKNTLPHFAKSVTPNFADPIYEAIKREKAAGVPANQIYIDRDRRLVGPDNPMGLLVANRRDEPIGGFQGVNRVMAEGNDPKKSGIPNFAGPLTRQQFIERGQFVSKETLSSINSLIASLNGLDSSRIKTVAANIRTLSEDFNKSAKGLVTGQILSAQKLARSGEGRVIRDGGTRLNIEENGNVANSGANIAELIAQNRVSANNIKLLTQKGLINNGSDQFFRGKIKGGKDVLSPEALREEFLQNQLNDRRNLGFNRAKERLVSGGNVTPAQINLIKEELRQEASKNASKFFAPGTPNSVTSAFSKQSAEFNFSRLQGQRQDLFNETAFVNSQARRKTIVTKGRVAQAEFRNKVGSASLGAAFALPFASGFIDEGAGGTTSGKVRGGIKGALEGAGTGALLGPEGAAIGAVIGGLIGVFGKLNKSAEEMAAEFDKQAEYRNNENIALSRAIQLQNQLNDARKNGGSKTDINNLTREFNNARSAVNSDSGKRILALSGNAQDVAKQNFEDAAARETAKGNVQKFLSTDSINKRSSNIPGVASGNDTFAQIFKGAITDKDALAVSEEQLSALQKIANGKGFLQENPSSSSRAFSADPNNAIFNASGLGLAIDQSSIKEFANILKTLEPLAKTGGINTSSITPDNARSLANGIVTAITARKNDISNAAQLEKDNKGASGRLPEGSLLTRPNLDAFGQSVQASRNIFSSQGSRAQGKYDFYKSIEETGAVSKGAFDTDPNFIKARAGVQSSNAGELALKFLESNNVRTGGLRSSRGDPILGAIGKRLGNYGISGARNSEEALVLKDVIEKATETQKANGGLPTYPLNFSSSNSGLVPGNLVNKYSPDGKPLGLYSQSNAYSSNKNFIETPLEKRPVKSASGKILTQRDTSEDYNKQPEKTRDDHINAYLKAASDMKDSAEKLNSFTLKIVMDIRGLDDEKQLTPLKKAMEEIIKLRNDFQSSIGLPNPPGGYHR